MPGIRGLDQNVNVLATGVLVVSDERDANGRDAMALARVGSFSL